MHRWRLLHAPTGSTSQRKGILFRVPNPGLSSGVYIYSDSTGTLSEAFTNLSKIYGDIFSINLGSIPCVVVNNFSLIKEVLITKGADFGGRPDFKRFHMLFGG
ncbi:hypothetical protein NQ317_014216 [Molorchus minor]|uniref:Uncharacterized protein n=1 Tax=Molorchus minor TaxID=1323400 RepID=A0ABQ9JEE4_9CUCU|nr:hypothetical protein NQ317_014216 [Molorchus minor]